MLWAIVALALEGLKASMYNVLVWQLCELNDQQ